MIIKKSVLSNIKTGCTSRRRQSYYYPNCNSRNLLIIQVNNVIPFLEDPFLIGLCREGVINKGWWSGVGKGKTVLAFDHHPNGRGRVQTDDAIKKKTNQG